MVSDSVGIVKGQGYMGGWEDEGATRWGMGCIHLYALLYEYCLH